MQCLDHRLGYVACRVREHLTRFTVQSHLALNSVGEQHLAFSSPLWTPMALTRGPDPAPIIGSSHKTPPPSTPPNWPQLTDPHRSLCDLNCVCITLSGWGGWGKEWTAQEYSERCCVRDTKVPQLIKHLSSPCSRGPALSSDSPTQ